MTPSNLLPLWPYRYKAVTPPPSKIVTGEYYASSAHALYTFLKDQNLSLISYKKKSSFLLYSAFWKQTTLRAEDTRDFFFHLGNFLSLDIPVLEAIKSMHETPYSKSLKILLTHLELTLASGFSLSQSFEKSPLRLSPLIFPLLRLAEKTGTLPLVCKELFAYFKERVSSQKLFQKTLQYPLILFGAISVACGSLFFFLVPELTKFLLLTGQEPPSSTLLLIRIKDFFLQYGYSLLFGIGISSLLFKISEKVPRLQNFLSPLSYKIPFFGKLKALQDQAYFIKAFSLLLTHHIPFYESLLTLEKTVPSLFLQKDLQYVLSSIGEGKKPSIAFQRSFYNTIFFQKMLVVGESSNSLGETLSLGSQHAISSFQEARDKFLGRLEPALTFILGGVLLWIASAFILPLYNSLLYLDTHP